MAKKRVFTITFSLDCGPHAGVGRLLGFWIVVQRRQDDSAEKLAKVEQGSIARSVVATGKIEPLSKVEIKSKASGIIKFLYVNVGDKVREGQLLVELDKETLEAQLKEARAFLKAAEGNIRRCGLRGIPSRQTFANHNWRRKAKTSNSCSRIQAIQGAVRPGACLEIRFRRHRTEDEGCRGGQQGAAGVCGRKGGGNRSERANPRQIAG